jgi:hypothetical protein
MRKLNLVFVDPLAIDYRKQSKSHVLYVQYYTMYVYNIYLI